MDDELDLQIGIPSSEQLLRNALQDGCRFFSRRETAAILGIKPGKAGDLMKYCRLDAFWIGGEYRVHWSAIADFLENLEDIRQQYLGYLSFTQSREVRKFWKVRSLMRNGCKIEKARILLEKQNVKDWLIWRIADRKLQGRYFKAQEDEIRDYYDIPGMELPSIATCRQWASLIGTRPSVIGHPLDFLISYPEMYDWLVEREIINLPVFQTTAPQEQKKSTSPYRQLSLF